jgi:hypothetical protein
VIIATLAMFVVACSEAGPQPTEFRGRVIDQDTGQPIAGAIVVGRYTGSRGFEGSTSCNFVESAVSDQDGWFTMPIDSRYGQPLMEAYHQGYRWGRSTRWAQRAADGDLAHWQVQVVKWNPEVTRGTLVRYEPTIYFSEPDAIAASRQYMDVYLKSFNGTREARLDELHRLTNAGICGGRRGTTAGPRPFFEAIYAEEVKLADRPYFLQSLRELISDAGGGIDSAKAKK